MMRKGKKVIGAALSGCMTASMFLTAWEDRNRDFAVQTGSSNLF